MKEYVATFKSSYQISPDDFKVYNPSIKVVETTTVREIADFFRQNNQSKSTLVEITLIELAQLSTS